MAHYIAIAKASLAAGLLRPDPTSVSRDHIAHFHVLLDAAVTQCSPANVQKCKEWLLENTTQSSARVSALGKYLIALSASFKTSGNGAQSTKETPAVVKRPNKRRSLHVLYLLNDLLHHTKYHSEIPSSVHSSITSNLQPHLVELVGSAAYFPLEKNRKLHKRVGELLDTWQDNGYYASDYVNKLREAAENAGNAGAANKEAKTTVESGEPAEPTKKASGKDAPFVMPASHGDPATPYYDLPAGNFMPHIIPNSATPINSSLVKPLQFVAEPADESLAMAVKDFLKEADAIYHTAYNFDEGIVADIDELGQPMTRDEVTGELSGGDGYYGWSRAFCDRMKQRRRAVSQTDKRRHSSDYSRSRSRSREDGARKRPRYSSGLSSRSRSRSRSRPDSRSLPRQRLSRSRHRSRSPFDSRSPPNRRSRFRPRTRSPSPTRRPEAPQMMPLQNFPTAAPIMPIPSSFPQMPGFPAATAAVTAPLPPPPTAAAISALLAQGFPLLGPGGMPIPPPPPYHTGPWPPPPPQMMPGTNFNPQQLPQFPMFPTFTHPHPPPPPPSAGGPGYQGFSSSPPRPPTGPGGAFGGAQGYNSSSPLQQGYGQGRGQGPPTGSTPMQPRAFGGGRGFGGQNGWQQGNGYGQRGRGRGR